MPKGAEKPVVKNPTHDTLEAYIERHVEIVKTNGKRHTGKMAMVREGVIVLHIRHEAGHLEPFGIVTADIESVQEVKKPRV